MRKRILSLLLTLTMLCAFVPATAVRASSQDELLKKLKNNTSDTIIETYYDDFDGDGQDEMFAITGQKSTGNVWFVSNSTCEKLQYNYSNASPSATDKFKVIDINGKKYFNYFEIYGNGQTVTIVCFIGKSNKITAKQFNGYMSGDENGLYVTNSVYDCQISKNDFNAGNYSGGMRSWKNYWYYYDETADDFKEYGGTEITKEQFCQFDGAEDILNLVTEGYIYNILYRANGIININILEESGLFKENDAYNCTNILVGYDDGSVWVIEDENDDYSPNIHSGFYLPALDEDIAVYPEFEIKNDAIKIVINDREITPIQEPVIQSGTTLVHIRTFEEVGASVEWDDSTKTATITKGNRVVQATVDDRALKVNNGEIYGGLIATQIINDCTMVPLRAITEAMGGVVNWIEDTRTIDIYYSGIIDAIINNSTEDDGSSGVILKLASQSNDIRTTFSNFDYSYEFLNSSPYDIRRIFNNYKYCYDYMKSYYDDEFLSGFIMAFDDPFIPIETIANELLNYGSILNYNNKTPKLDLSEAFAAENVADAIAEMIENVSDSSIDLYEVDSEVKTIMSKLKSASGLVLSEDSSLQGLSCFSEFLKGANFAIKIHDEWSDILESALTDYGVSIEYLNAIEEALTDNGLMDETLADSINCLKVEYNAWFIDEISDFAANQLSSKITSLIGTAVNITGKGTWGFVNFVREGLNVASRNKNRAALLKKIYSYTTIDLPLSRCYTYYADKIYSGDYTTNDVLLCEKLFEICKISRITVYKNVYALNEVDSSNIGQHQRYNTDLGISEAEMLKSNIEDLESLSY